MSNSQDTLLTQAEALERGAVLHARPDLALLRVRGDDRTRWLNGQITNEVRELAPGESVHALAVNVRGKILAELWVSALSDELLVIIPSKVQRELLESFERYIIMEDVTLEAAVDARVLAIEGPLARELASRVQTPQGTHGFAWDPLGLGGYVWVGTSAQLDGIAQALAPHAPMISEDAYELVRLRRAVPRFGVDFDAQHYPQEAGLKAYVSFHKGCYLGQEVVCTLENRGRLSRQLCWLRSAASSGATYGALIHAPPGEAIGSVTSVRWDPRERAALALGYVKRAHANPGATLAIDGAPFQLVRVVGADADEP